MDIYFLFHGQQFVWDSEKAAINLAKHGVRFETACEVFFDPFVRLEDATDSDEARDAAIGLSEDWALLFVVHLSRADEALRIISARPANAQERRLYEDCN
jgi:uncharacterized DUF497 family protein